LACHGSAHNPAHAGSLVQIQPPQPTFPTAVAYRVYVLQNWEGKFYIGLSDDIRRRIHQHNAGNSKWTRGKGPWTLMWQSKEMKLSDARKLEPLLKRQKGSDGFYRMIGLPRFGS
jgi:putative endonuclease